MLCFVLAEALIEKLGGDSVGEMQVRYQQLPSGRWEDLALSNEPTIFWE
jgi:chorismate synthase